MGICAFGWFGRVKRAGWWMHYSSSVAAVAGMRERRVCSAAAMMPGADARAARARGQVGSLAAARYAGRWLQADLAGPSERSDIHPVASSFHKLCANLTWLKRHNPFQGRRRRDRELTLPSAGPSKDAGTCWLQCAPSMNAFARRGCPSVRREGAVFLGRQTPHREPPAEKLPSETTVAKVFRTSARAAQERAVSCDAKMHRLSAP